MPTDEQDHKIHKLYENAKQKFPNAYVYVDAWGSVCIDFNRDPGREVQRDHDEGDLYQ